MCALITEFYDQPNTTLDKFILHTSISPRMEIYLHEGYLEKLKIQLETNFGQELLHYPSYHETISTKEKETKVSNEYFKSKYNYALYRST
jgi:hypothetical protein